MDARDGTMILFDEDRVSNLLPKDGTVYYYGKVLSSSEANQYFDLLMKNILWKNDYGAFAYFTAKDCHFTSIPYVLCISNDQFSIIFCF